MTMMTRLFSLIIFVLTCISPAVHAENTQDNAGKRELTQEEGLSDAVYLDIIKINDDGTKNAMLDFFSADRKQAVNPDNVTNITGNPILGIFMQGDVYAMNRLMEGRWRR